MSDLRKALEQAAEALEIYADPSGYHDTYGEEYTADDTHPGIAAGLAAKAARDALALSLGHPIQGEALPERDWSRPTDKQGLFHKFDIRRVDGSDEPGRKHHGCRYFVLDVDHDMHASVALAAYAEACEVTHPQLAKDLRNEWQVPASTGVGKHEWDDAGHCVRCGVDINDVLTDYSCHAALSNQGTAVAWLHVLHKEHGEVEEVVSVEMTAEDVYGVQGRDYDPSYTVTSTPLFASHPPTPAGVREITDEIVGRAAKVVASRAGSSVVWEEHEALARAVLEAAR